MDGNKSKEGMSVKEISAFAKKHRFEVYIALLFVLACLFSFIFFGSVWAVFAVMIGGVLGAFFPERMEGIAAAIMGFCLRQEQTTMLILAIVGLIFAIFIPPLIFLLIGAHSGVSILNMATDLASKSKK